MLPRAIAKIDRSHRDKAGKILGQVLGFEDAIVTHLRFPHRAILRHLRHARKGDNEIMMRLFETKAIRMQSGRENEDPPGGDGAGRVRKIGAGVGGWGAPMGLMQRHQVVRRDRPRTVQTKIASGFQ